MKEILKSLYEYKSMAAIFFLGEMFVYGIVSEIYNIEMIRVDMIWQMIIIAFVTVLVIGLFYNNSTLERVSIFIRGILTYVSLVVLYTFSAVQFGWLDFLDENSVLSFVIGFSLLYLLCMNSMYLYYRITGERFNEKLNKYKNNKR